MWAYYEPPIDNTTLCNTSNYNKFFNEYIACFYWSTQMLTTIAETNDPTRNIETIITIFVLLLAVVLVATLVGNIGSVISNMTVEKTKFDKKVKLFH
jgi:uncharacterized membrane protein